MSLNQLLKFSIVIPCRNEENFIGNCIHSVLNNGYPLHLLEILVCDGLSTDNTQSIVNQIITASPNVKLILNPARYTPAGLNAGIQTAVGDIILILGAHSVLHPGYLEKCAALLAKYPEAGCVGGLVRNKHENKLSEIIGLAMSSSFGVGNARFRTGGKDGFVDTVAFGAYRKEVFVQCGLFDEELVRNQDDELNYRIQKKGFKIYFSSSLQSEYFVRSSFKKLYSQYFQYGYWKVFVNKKHGIITSWRQIVPLLFVLFLLSGIAVFTILPALAVTWQLLLAAYFLLALYSSVRLKTNPVNYPVIILTFIILHLSYGIGYLEGIFRFIILNRKPEAKRTNLTR